MYVCRYKFTLLSTQYLSHKHCFTLLVSSYYNDVLDAQQHTFYLSDKLNVTFFIAYFFVTNLVENILCSISSSPPLFSISPNLSEIGGIASCCQRFILKCRSLATYYTMHIKNSITLVDRIHLFNQIKVENLITE